MTDEQAILWLRSLRRIALYGLAVCLIALSLFVCIFLLCGCVNVTATRTTSSSGVVTDTITVKSFLESITDGTYGTTNGMLLSTTSATPDQQSISVLAGVVGDLGKSAMLMAARPTNTINVVTNAPLTSPPR
jgi:hypothetical protein